MNAIHLPPWLNRYRWPLLTGIGLRIVTSLWLAVVWFFVDSHFPRTPLAIQETYNQLKVHSTLLGRMLLDVWLRWDAVHYMNLAYGGYENSGLADLNFWPLYPYLVRLINFILPQETVFWGLLVSTLATIAAMVLFWELVISLFHHERLADWTVIAWAIFPTSFFLVAPFTDSLFACLSLGSLLMMQRKRWLFAGFLAALAGLARSQGILLVFALLFSIVQNWRKTQARIPASAISGLVLAPLGTGLFMIWRQQLGLLDIFTSFNTYTRAVFVDPFTAIYLAARQLLLTPDLLQVTELLSVLLFLGVQVWMVSRPEFRNGGPFLLYGILNILFNLTKHNLAASPLQSSNRYVLNALPAFVGFAWVMLALAPKYRSIWIVVSITLAVIACALYALWIFVG